ncbi:efflux RND transporter periplasmic adaptor subunit [Porifericola rhodea]|uniref:efflux RND transporter periplasmic adaptor subunit n=1 Tax=Porifericola rhodea TaxID=930972 RepID=UPI00266576BF|nr:efflux RND transporter periplasmic adaptor subunit [Porifericola rhodea]WKN31935.1 efflux RND transporter periplasmic adaptor subunit [Porifericola rhodea]
MTIKTKTALRYLLMLGLGMLLGWLVWMPATEDPEEHEHEFVPTETAEGTVWTCSMHPQVRQSEAGDCPICGMDLIPLEEEEGEANPYQLTMSAEAVRLANVQTTKVGSPGTYEEESKALLLNGKLEIDETRIITQTAHFSGRVEKMFLTYEGAQVRRGQTIATIYSPELVTAQQELLQAQKFKASNPNLLASATRKLKNWKLTDSQIMQILERDEPITYWPLKAHASGIVTNINVESGEHVMEGAVIYEAADLSQLWAVFDAYENNLSWIKKGDMISFEVAAYPGKQFDAKVSFIDPFIDPQSRVAKVRTEVSNEDGLLKPAMFAQGRLSSREQTSVVSSDAELLVPKSAVMWTGTRSVVYVVVQNTNIPTYEMREVTLGASVGNAYLVESGLRSGEEVVSQGTFTVDAAAQLNNKASMMNRNVQIKGSATKAEQMQLSVPDYVSQTSETFKNQFQKTINQYLELKDALVSSEKEAANKYAQAMMKSVAEVDMNLLEDEPHIYWMEREEGIKDHVQLLLQSKNIDMQRKHFKQLSLEMIKATQAFGTSEKLYVQYCPMADNDEGANWLSVSEEVINPYYGDMMLNCGNVKTIINP